MTPKVVRVRCNVKPEIPFQIGSCFNSSVPLRLSLFRLKSLPPSLFDVLLLLMTTGAHISCDKFVFFYLGNKVLLLLFFIFFKLDFIVLINCFVRIQVALSWNKKNKLISNNLFFAISCCQGQLIFCWTFKVPPYKTLFELCKGTSGTKNIKQHFSNWWCSKKSMCLHFHIINIQTNDCRLYCTISVRICVRICVRYLVV